MSNTRVVETVWPWRERDAAVAQPGPKKPSLVRVFVEVAIMVTVALVLQFKLDKVWVPRVIFTMAGLTLVGGLFIPRLHAGLQKVGRSIGNAAAVGVTWLLLVPFFYLCFPVGRLLFRLSGKDALARRRDPGATSYWVPHRKVADPKRYENQY